MFQKAFEDIIVIERGYSNDPLDSGGETKWGISTPVARKNGYIGDIKEMPIEFAKKVYLACYWNLLHLDTIGKSSYAIAAELFDTAVNMGVSTAAKFLQRALNGFSGKVELDVDGRIGSLTIAYTKAYCEDRTRSVDALLKLLNAQQCVQYLKIVESKPSQAKYLKGWIDKRVNI